MTIPIQRGKAVEVDRGSGRIYAGQGIIKGLAVIWSHWGKSWTKKLEHLSDIDGVFTVEYPEERLVLPEASRNMPILLYEDATGHELCTSCFQCERICPPQVIHIKQAKHPETGKPVPAAEEFIIEYDACMGCGLCAEVCPFDSIKMDQAYELSTHDHPSLTVHKRGLLRPVSYYQSNAPGLWEEVKDNAYKKLDGSKKRRVGTQGIAPQFLESPPPARTVAPKAAGTTARAAAGAPAGPKKPLAPIGKNMSEEKAARLQAIRAQKAAQGGGGAVESATGAVEPEVEMQDTGSGVSVSGSAIPFGADNIMAGIPANSRMSEDKLAKLRAIREANLRRRG